MNKENLTAKAAVLTRLGAPLEIIEGIKIPILKPGQVLVQMHYSGVCHSQLMEARGLRGKDPWLPHMLGHEGTGKVLKVGSSVTKAKVGDSVVLGWIKGAGLDAGGAQYEGPNGEIINAGGVTTFSDYTVVSENRLVLLPSGTSADLGVLYGCALPTGAGMVMNQVKPHINATIVVFGLGGIGISALMVSALYSPRKLVAIDVEDSKLELAKSLGATHTYNPRKIDVVEKVREITDSCGVDYAIEAAGLNSTISSAFEMVRRGGGRCIFASHPASGDKLQLDPFELICGKHIEGSWGGNSIPDKDIPILGDLYEKGCLPLEKLLSHTYTLDNINEALDDLESRKIVRALIRMTPP